MLFKRFHDSLHSGFRTLFLPLILSLPLLATAGPFSNLYVFGDSLSDTGNLLGTGAPRPFPFAGPYMGDRFSNGPLWVEHLAQGLGLSPQAAAPFIYGGNNYAFAGAQTGIYPAPPADQIPGVLAQVGGIWAPTRTGPTDPNALYVVVAGGNDMRDARSLFGTNSATDIAGRQAAAVNAITNLANTLGLLATLGAKNILVATLPDLGIHRRDGSLQRLAAAADGHRCQFWFEHESAGHSRADERHPRQPGGLRHYRHQQPLLWFCVQHGHQLRAVGVLRHPAPQRAGACVDWPRGAVGVWYP
jgi:outer membrane lipase/esterase